MDDVSNFSSLVTAILQILSSGLILVSITFAKNVHERLRDLENMTHKNRLILEKKINDLRLQTTLAIKTIDKKTEEKAPAKKVPAKKTVKTTAKKATK